MNISTKKWLFIKCSSLALIPLMIWFALNLVKIFNSDYDGLRMFFSSQPSQSLFSLFVVFSLFFYSPGLAALVVLVCFCAETDSTARMLFCIAWKLDENPSCSWIEYMKMAMMKILDRYDRVSVLCASVCNESSEMIRAVM